MSPRLWRALALALIAVGALALIDATVTLVWQEPFSALYAKLEQDKLNGDLRSLEHAAPTPVEQRALASLTTERRRIAYLAGELERRTGDGGAVGRIVIPRIDASFVVVKGTDTADLERGPGIYPQTPFPGAEGTTTTAIAGHRTTYLAPFRHIDSLRAGNRIMLLMPYAHFTYKVDGQRVVSPNDVAAAIGGASYTRLVLSACTPLFSAAKRLLVYAVLTRIQPVGKARILPGGARATAIELHGPARRPAAPSPAVFEPGDSKLLSTGVQ
ncbi:MAG TPA: class E sortase [Solirubrobacteraceae bacterium]|nr:class E sortase [Solirubrobacteraceae bacterium]